MIITPISRISASSENSAKRFRPKNRNTMDITNAQSRPSRWHMEA